MLERAGSWDVGYRLDLRAVLGPFVRGPHDPTTLLDPQSGAWQAAATPDGPATVRMRTSGTRVDAEAWGPGADWVLTRVPALLGADDDPSGFPGEALPPSLHQAYRRYGDRWRVPRSGRVLEALVAAVLEQKVPGMQARQGWKALIGTFGEPAPGPVPRPMQVFPDAAVVRRIPSWQWHRWNVPPPQADTVMRVVAHAGRLSECADLPIDRARARMTAVPGVGPWTVAETSSRALGDADAVSVGDFHVPGLVCVAFTGERGSRADADARMLVHLAPFAGHRYRVQRLVELAGISLPRRGPRLEIADHRDR